MKLIRNVGVGGGAGGKSYVVLMAMLGVIVTALVFSQYMDSSWQLRTMETMVTREKVVREKMTNKTNAKPIAAATPAPAPKK